jgi:hypothetical protein
VIGNFIGTDKAGEASLGNQGDGIWSRGIGTTITHNLISANKGAGVYISGFPYDTVSNATVQANLIGTASDGVSKLGNEGYGVVINGSRGNHIGGEQDGQGNTIAFNAKTGVVLFEKAGTSVAVDNSILRNVIYENGGESGLAIDLGDDGMTPDDQDDVDEGVNHLQNYPLLSVDENSVIHGSINSAPGKPLRVEFFLDQQCDPFTPGDAEIYLGTITVTPDAEDNAVSFLFASPHSLLPGEYIVGTATDPDGNTSELSPCPENLVFKVKRK